MRYLYKIWYKNPDAAQALYAQYMEDGDSLMLPFDIYPMEFNGSYTLFYRASHEMMGALEKIYQQDMVLRHLGDLLPEIAKEDFLRNLVVEEIFNSSEIEQVHSTRREIALSVREAAGGKARQKRRLLSMAHSYWGLAHGDVMRPKNLADIREVYDYITEGEISEENLPDGEYFRKAQNVVENSTGRVIHRGVALEEKIKEAMQSLLDFMDGDVCPALVKVAVAHYVFGYVHPFYDGNGRTGRFLSSLYLSEICSEFTAYSLSQGCRLQQKKYYELFDRTNKFNSFGEMNLFIEGFFDILVQGQRKIMENLQERRALLDQAHERVGQDERLLGDGFKQDVMFVFEQKRLFAIYDEGLTREEMTEIMQQLRGSAAYSHVCRCLKELEGDGCIRRIKDRPITYVSAMEDRAPDERV